MKNRQILDEIRIWKEENATRYGIVEMCVFGSVARGEETPESDVDIVVTMKEPDLFEMSGIRIDLEQHLNKRVDVVHSGTPDRFLEKRIERDKIIV